MILKVFKKIKIILLKIIIKFLKSIFKKNYPPIIKKIIVSAEYKEFFTTRENFKSLFINDHSDAIWILENLNKKGFCIIENFWSEEDCIKGINNINSIIRKYPDYVQNENKSDSRVYGAENISRNINNFAKDKLLLSVAEQYNRKKRLWALHLQLGCLSIIKTQVLEKDGTEMDFTDNLKPYFI